MWRLLWLLCFGCATVVVNARLECQSSVYCERTIREGSMCVEGFCSNPYQTGCLQTQLKDFDQQRVCNSEDPENAAEKGLCRVPEDTDYAEIRIMSQNWESPFFEAWILQILLSEVLDVPVTIETGTSDTNVNFYNAENRFEYGVSYDMDGLKLASEIGDCRLVDKGEGDEYKGCGHAILEIWSGQEDVIAELLEIEAVEPKAFIGVIGEEGWQIPKYTAEADSSLLSHFGLAGEENRNKLADRFLRPTTWGDYCSEVSPNGCTSGTDSTAARAPETLEEEQQYFVSGVYTGHFRKTEDNDCEKWPKNCTGHFLDYPCGWSSFFVQQAHHLNIGLKSNGEQPGANGYSYAHMVEIWYAANWTKSDVIGWWWRPEALYQQFQGTDFELQNIVLPPTNHRCIDNRMNIAERCGDDDALRVGNREGSCDVPPIPNYKLLSSGLYKLIYDPEIPEGRRSPAYDVVKEFTIDGFQLGEIFELWLGQNVDKYGYDPRNAVCTWVAENFDELQRFIPRTHPRAYVEEEEKAIDLIALATGAVAAFVTVVSSFMTYKQKGKRVFQFAQVEFVFLLLFGLLLVSTAAVLTAIPPTNARCVAIAWLLNVGYSFELVPLVVKIAAINRLFQAAKRMKRIKLSRKLLFGGVAFLTSAVVIYMIFWTAIDPPSRKGEYILTDGKTSSGKTIVNTAYFCQSDSRVWMLVAVGGQAFFLVCASILAFLTRKMRKDINEANTISFLIYWNFVCVLLRVILLLLEGSIDASRTNRSLSMILSADSIATIVIYFVPKFADKTVRSASGAHNFVSVGVPQVWQTDNAPSHSLRLASDSRLPAKHSRVSFADLPAYSSDNGNVSERSISNPGDNSQLVDPAQDDSKETSDGIGEDMLVPSAPDSPSEHSTNIWLSRTSSTPNEGEHSC